MGIETGLLAKLLETIIGRLLSYAISTK